MEYVLNNGLKFHGFAFAAKNREVGPYCPDNIILLYIIMPSESFKQENNDQLTCGTTKM